MDTSPTDPTPLVCIHGFSGSWRNWVPIIPALERHHDVHVARLAGHARGPALPAGTKVTVVALADQLERDLDGAGIEQAHLVGNSLGGWLALELAGRGRALSVTALAPALGWQPRGPHLRKLAFKLKASHAACTRIAPYAEFLLKPPRVRHALFHQGMVHGERLTVIEAAAFVRDTLRCSIYDELMHSFLNTDHQLADIDCPVRIAWSEHDGLIPHHPYGDRFPALVPHAEFTTIAGVGHIPMYDDPALVVDTIVPFTAAIDRVRTPTPLISPAKT